LIGIAPVYPAEDAPFENLILISVDGLNYEGYSSYDKNSLKYLALDGASTAKCLAVRADTIEAGEASLLTGCLPEEHLHYSRNDKVEAESLLDVICKSGRSILVVDGSGGRLQGFARGQEEYVKIESQQPDSKVMEKAIALFLEKKPFLTYIYLDDCKTTAPRVKSEDHYKNLRNVDLEIGKLVKALKDWNMYGETGIIVTSSRSSSPSDMVPLIVKSSGVRANVTLQGVNVIDITPTICALAGLEGPHSSSGVILWNAFMPGKKYGSETLIRRQVDELEKERVRVWTRFYQSMKERDSLSHQIAEIKEEQQSIFDYAGQNEQTIAHLRKRLNQGKGLMAGMIVLFLIGYLIEYRWLKRRFMLFK
jgi:chorismate mutase